MWYFFPNFNKTLLIISEDPGQTPHHGVSDLNLHHLPMLHKKNARLIHVWIYEPRHEISNNVVCATSKGSDQPAHMHRLIRAFACRLNIIWILSY